MLKVTIIGMLVALGLGCRVSDGTARAQKAGRSIDEHQELRGPADTAIDPVTMKSVETDASWKAKHAGRTCYFDSEEAMNQFVANPSRYVHEDGRIKDPERRVQSEVK